jgi:CDP-glucose 4,6-dehydratase
MAAQPLVLRSYDEPLETFSVNVLGTANILEAAFSTPSVKVVLVVTTDKVYRNHESGVRFKESDALAGKDPYSASKVGAESVCAAWQQISKVSGGPKVIVARAGNVIGGGDFSENRIIPDIIRGVIANKPTLIRNPISTRPWQHVLDPLAGYLSFIEQTLNGSVQSEVFNFGPCESSLSVQELVEIGKETFGERLQIKLGSPDGEKEATTLELDSSSALEKISWRPKWSQREAIRLTFEWWNLIIADNKHAYKRCLHEIEEFLAKT